MVWVAAYFLVGLLTDLIVRFAIERTAYKLTIHLLGVAGWPLLWMGGLIFLCETTEF